MLRHLPILIVLPALLLAACDEELVPPDEIEAYYTLWGALDPTADTQAVRIIPLSREVGQDTVRTIDAQVTSTHVATGETVAWRDSVVTFPNGTVGHIFLGALGVEYNARYRIDVARSDGRTTTAFTSVPPAVVPIEPILQLAPGNALYRVVWPGAPQLNDVRVEYELENGGCDRVDLTIPFEGDSQPIDFGWQTTLSLTDESERVLARLDGRPHAVTRVTLSTDIASEDWRPPGGVYDPEVIVEPGTFSNVQRGFGFVGGAYRTSVSFVPSTAAIVRTRFSLPGFGACAH